MNTEHPGAKTAAGKTRSRRTVMLFGLAAAVLLGVVSLISMYLPGDLNKRKGKLALVEVSGIITGSEDTVRQLAKYRRDDSIDGVVLRVNSPGGAVAPSQEIYDEVIRVKKAKKIFTSMGTLAASGGYYIASPTDLIVANPGTLTGSIGVVMTFATSEKLLAKIGIHPEVLKSGPFKDTGNAMRPMNDADRKVLQTVVDDVYDQFVAAVASGRNMDIETVKKLADGRVYSGRQAYRLKLVDRLGGLEKTISLLAREVGIQGRPKVVREEAKTPFLEWLLEGTVPKKIINTLSPVNLPALQFLWAPG